MSTYDLIWWSLITGIVSALATGLGALPVALIRDRSARVRAFASAGAAGMMIAASVFSLAEKGLDIAPFEVMAGLLAGTAFFALAERYLPHPEGNGRRGWLIFLAMFIHSFPEGLAIGVGFATGDLRFGILMALAISVHNIPEGVAISLPLRVEGASLAWCIWMSILSSVPQPLAAVPAALAAWFFQPLLPFGLGFAGGAMMYLAVTELISDALEEGGKALTGWGVMLGLIGMLAVTVLLERWM